MILIFDIFLTIEHSREPPNTSNILPQLQRILSLSEGFLLKHHLSYKTPSFLLFSSSSPLNQNHLSLSSLSSLNLPKLHKWGQARPSWATPITIRSPPPPLRHSPTRHGNRPCRTSSVVSLPCSVWSLWRSWS